MTIIKNEAFTFPEFIKKLKSFQSPYDKVIRDISFVDCVVNRIPEGMIVDRKYYKLERKFLFIPVFKPVHLLFGMFEAEDCQLIRCKFNTVKIIGLEEFNKAKAGQII